MNIVLKSLIKEKELNGKSICFLLGSGFSVPYGFETVGDINKMFASLKIEDIIISPARQVFFAKGEKDPNGWMNINERSFFVDFIEFYCSNLEGGSNFHYEDFYDFYHSRYRGEKNQVIDDFCKQYRAKYNMEESAANNVVNLLLSFDNIFTQLLASKLSRRALNENGVHYANYPPYDQFLNYISYLINAGYIIHIFTLNHDILLDHMCANSNLWESYSDGYDAQGSPFFGDLTIQDKVQGTGIPDITNVYKVRLKRFTDKFDNQIRIYKLHGSIDTHIINVRGFDRPRVKNMFAVHDFYVEKEDDHGKLVYERSVGNNFPDYLSGTTEKLRSYSDSYYEVLFNHFKAELPNCVALGVIGYGFWDSGINNMLESGIFNNDIPVTVIDPYKPGGPLFKKYEDAITHLKESLDNVHFDEFKVSIVS